MTDPDWDLWSIEQILKLILRNLTLGIIPIVNLNIDKAKRLKT